MNLRIVYAKYTVCLISSNKLALLRYKAPSGAFCLAVLDAYRPAQAEIESREPYCY